MASTRLPPTRRRKPPRLRDIADRAQLSVTAVSMALRGSSQIGEETRNRVREIAQRMGYRVRPGGRRTQPAAAPQRRFGLGLIDTRPGLSANALIRGVSAAAQRLQARVEFLMLSDVSDRERALEQLIAFAGRLGGLLLWGHVDRTIIEGVARASLPCVVLGETSVAPDELPEEMIHIVSHDPIDMGWRATESLLARGHRRIAFICEEMPPRMYNAGWFAGYRQAHGDVGIAADRSLCIVCGTRGTAGERGVKAVMAMRERPTACVISDASAAALFLEAMKARAAAPPPDAVVIGGEKEDVERYGFSDHGMIISKLDRIAETGLTMLDHSASGMPLLCGRFIVPFRTRNLPAVNTTAQA